MSLQTHSSQSYCYKIILVQYSCKNCIDTQRQAMSKLLHGFAVLWDTLDYIIILNSTKV